MKRLQEVLIQWNQGFQSTACIYSCLTRHNRPGPFHSQPYHQGVDQERHGLRNWNILTNSNWKKAVNKNNQNRLHM